MLSAIRENARDLYVAAIEGVNKGVNKPVNKGVNKEVSKGVNKEVNKRVDKLKKLS